MTHGFFEEDEVVWGCEEQRARLLCCASRMIFKKRQISTFPADWLVSRRSLPSAAEFANHVLFKSSSPMSVSLSCHCKESPTELPEAYFPRACQLRY